MASLSSLPPELVRQIIESAVPHTFQSTTYRTRQRTLCALSLVSRRFRAIAHPLLLEIVYIESDGQLKLFLETRIDTQEIKELIVKKDTALERIEQLLSRWKGIQNLVIERWLEGKPVDLAVLVQHTQLVSLRLSGFGFRLTNRRPLTALKSLTFDLPDTKHLCLTLLDPELLPSLRVLGLDNMDEDGDLQQLEETGLSRLLPQLDAIFILSDLYRLGNDDLFSGYSSRILVDVYLGTLDPPTLI